MSGKRLNRWWLSIALAAPIGWMGLAISNSWSASAQDAAQGRELHQTYDLAPNGEVGLINPSGQIRVTTWDQNRVKVDAVKNGRSDDEINQIQIQVTSTPARLQIQTMFRGNWRIRGETPSVNFELTVPRTAILNSISSNSGDITITGPVGGVTARSTSGNLTVQDLSDAANLSTTSGNIRADRIRGDLRAISASGNVVVNDVQLRLTAQAASGSITATNIRDDATASATSGNVKLERIGGRAIARSHSGSVVVLDAGGDVQADCVSDNVLVSQVKGRVNATSISGSIIVRQVQEGVRASSISGRLQLDQIKGRIETGTTSDAITLTRIDSKDILAKSTSGQISFEGKFYDEGHYEFESFSGNVTLLLPPDSNFTISTKSQTGSVNTDFPLQLGTGSRPGRGYLNGTVGKGGAEVRAASFSGSVYLKKSTG